MGSGPAFDLVLHGVTSALGLESFGEATTAPAVLQVRHVVIAVAAVAGALATAALVGILTRSRRWAVVGFTLLVGIPMWAGHGMFNHKDVPVALGYTSVTLALVALASPRLSQGWRRLVPVTLLLVAGLTLAIGTRPGMWVPIAASVLAALGWLVYSAVRRRGAPESVRPVLVRMGALLVGLVVAYLCLLLVYPAPFSQPLLVLTKSLGESSTFAQEGQERPLSMIPGLAAYVPRWLTLQLPILQLLLLLLAIVLAGVIAWRAITGRVPIARWRAVALLLVALQMTVIPVATALLRSTVYDAIRHFLFILPPIAVFGALALRRLATWVEGRGSLVARRILWPATGVLLVLPLLDEIALFPYGYTYLNEAATLRPLNGEVPTDYWRLSLRELMPAVPSADYTSCQFRQSADELPTGEYWQCEYYGSVNPYWGDRGAALTGVRPDEFLFVESNRGLPYPPRNCTILDSVTRRLHFQDLTMSYVAVCRRS